MAEKELGNSDLWLQLVSDPGPWCAQAGAHVFRGLFSPISGVFVMQVTISWPSLGLSKLEQGHG